MARNRGGDRGIVVRGTARQYRGCIKPPGMPGQAHLTFPGPLPTGGRPTARGGRLLSFRGSGAGKVDNPASILPWVETVAPADFHVAHHDIERGHVEGVRVQRLDVLRLEAAQHLDLVGQQFLLDRLDLREQALEFDVPRPIEQGHRFPGWDFPYPKSVAVLCGDFSV